MSEDWLPCPEPGVHEDVPMEDYLRWDAVSNSGLGYMLRSPAHYQASIHEPVEATEAQRIGRAGHVTLLEPDDFEDRFYRVPDADPKVFRNKNGSESKNPANTSAYREAVRVMADENPDKDGLPGEVWDDAWRMRESALTHPRLRKIITATGRAELCIVWVDEATGVICKARLDWHTPSHAGGAIVDVKTCQDASPWAFGGAANKWGYYRQGAMYLRAAAAAELPAEHFVFAAIEKSPNIWTPDGLMHGCVLYRLSEEYVSMGSEQLDYALGLYAECKRTNEWPGYPTDVLDLTLPGWAGQDVERNTEEMTV